MSLLIHVYIFQVRPGEPVYAQVNRDKKKNSRPGVPGDPTQQQQMMMHYGDYSEH